MPLVKLCFSKVSDIKRGLLYGHFPSHIPAFLGGYLFRKTLSKVVKDYNFSSMPNNHYLIVQEQLSSFDWIKISTTFDKDCNYFKNMGEISQKIKRCICRKVFYKRFGLKNFSKFIGKKFQWI